MRKLLPLFFSLCLFTSVIGQTKVPDTLRSDTVHSIPYDTTKLFLLDAKVGYVIDSTEKAAFHLFTFWGRKIFWYAELYSLDEDQVLVEGTMRDKTVRQMVISYNQALTLRDQIEFFYNGLTDEQKRKLGPPRKKPVYVPCKVEIHVIETSNPTYYENEKRLFGSFIADSCGIKVKVFEEVYTDFLYYNCFNRQVFSGEYDKYDPSDFIVYDCDPDFLDSTVIKRTVATVTAIDHENVEFNFLPEGRSESITQFQKIDEWYTQSLWTARPDLIKNRKFFVDYDYYSPHTAILRIEEPADTATYFYRPKNNFIGTGFFPSRNFRLDLDHVISPSFCGGAMFTWWYPGKEYPSDNHTYDSYYYQFSHFSTFSPYLEWYPARTSPYGVYFKAWFNIAHAQGLLANYVNVPNAKPDSTVGYYVSLDSTRYSYLGAKAFETWGFGISLGGRFCIDNKYRWSVFGSIGYNYLHTPSEMEKPMKEDNELYYLYDFPVWKEILNQPFYIETGLQYRF